MLKTRFTDDEDSIILRYAFKKTWKTISEMLNRSDDSVRNRWNRLINVKSKVSNPKKICKKNKRTFYSQEEDKFIIEFTEKYGTKWNYLSTEFSNTFRKCDKQPLRNRWARLNRIQQRIDKGSESKKERIKQEENDFTIGRVTNIVDYNISSTQFHIDNTFSSQDIESSNDIINEFDEWFS